MSAKDVHSKDYMRESHRLREYSAHMRAFSIDTQLATGFTLCRLVETQLSYGHTAEALALLQRIAECGQRIERHLDETSYVPDHEQPVLRYKLEQLRSELLRIKACLDSSEANKTAPARLRSSSGGPPEPSAAERRKDVPDDSR